MASKVLQNNSEKLTNRDKASTRNDAISNDVNQESGTSSNNIIHNKPTKDNETPRKYPNKPGDIKITNERPSSSASFPNSLFVPDETHDPSRGIFHPGTPIQNAADETFDEMIQMTHTHTNNLKETQLEKYFSEQMKNLGPRLKPDAPPPEDKDYCDIYANTDKPVRREHFNEYKASRDEEHRVVMEFVWKATAQFREALQQKEIWHQMYLDAQKKLRSGESKSEEPQTTTRDNEDKRTRTESRLRSQSARRERTRMTREKSLAARREEINEPYLDADLYGEGANSKPSTARKPEFLYPDDHLSKFTEVQVDIKIMRLRALEVLKEWLPMQNLAQALIDNEAKQLDYAPLIARGWYYLGVAHYRQKHFAEALYSFQRAQLAVGHYDEGGLAMEWLARVQKIIENPSQANTPLSARHGGFPPAFTSRFRGDRPPDFTPVTPADHEGYWGLREPGTPEDWSDRSLDEL